MLKNYYKLIEDEKYKKAKKEYLDAYDAYKNSSVQGEQNNNLGQFIRDNLFNPVANQFSRYTPNSSNLFENVYRMTGRPLVDLGSWGSRELLSGIGSTVSLLGGDDLIRKVTLKEDTKVRDDLDINEIKSLQDLQDFGLRIFKKLTPSEEQVIDKSNTEKVIDTALNVIPFASGLGKAGVSVGKPLLKTGAKVGGKLFGEGVETLAKTIGKNTLKYGDNVAKKLSPEILGALNLPIKSTAKGVGKRYLKGSLLGGATIGGVGALGSELEDNKAGIDWANVASQTAFGGLFNTGFGLLEVKAPKNKTTLEIEQSIETPKVKPLSFQEAGSTSKQTSGVDINQPMPTTKSLVPKMSTIDDSFDLDIAKQKASFLAKQIKRKPVDVIPEKSSADIQPQKNNIEDVNLARYTSAKELQNYIDLVANDRSLSVEEKKLFVKQKIKTFPFEEKQIREFDKLFNGASSIRQIKQVVNNIVNSIDSNQYFEQLYKKNKLYQDTEYLEKLRYFNYINGKINYFKESIINNANSLNASLKNKEFKVAKDLEIKLQKSIKRIFTNRKNKYSKNLASLTYSLFRLARTDSKGTGYALNGIKTSKLKSAYQESFDFITQYYTYKTNGLLKLKNSDVLNSITAIFEKNGLQLIKYNNEGSSNFFVISKDIEQYKPFSDYEKLFRGNITFKITKWTTENMSFLDNIFVFMNNLDVINQFEKTGKGKVSGLFAEKIAWSKNKFKILNRLEAVRKQTIWTLSNYSRKEREAIGYLLQYESLNEEILTTSFDRVAKLSFEFKNREDLVKKSFFRKKAWYAEIKGDNPDEYLFNVLDYLKNKIIDSKILTDNKVIKSSSLSEKYKIAYDTYKKSTDYLYDNLNKMQVRSGQPLVGYRKFYSSNLNTYNNATMIGNLPDIDSVIKGSIMNNDTFDEAMKKINFEVEKVFVNKTVLTGKNERVRSNPFNRMLDIRESVENSFNYFQSTTIAKEEYNWYTKIQRAIEINKEEIKDKYKITDAEIKGLVDNLKNLRLSLLLKNKTSWLENIENFFTRRIVGQSISAVLNQLATIVPVYTQYGVLDSSLALLQTVADSLPLIRKQLPKNSVLQLKKERGTGILKQHLKDLKTSVNLFEPRETINSLYKLNVDALQRLFTAFDLFMAHVVYKAELNSLKKYNVPLKQARSIANEKVSAMMGGISKAYDAVFLKKNPAVKLLFPFIKYALNDLASLLGSPLVIESKGETNMFRKNAKYILGFAGGLLITNILQKVLLDRNDSSSLSNYIPFLKSLENLNTYNRGVALPISMSFLSKILTEADQLDAEGLGKLLADDLAKFVGFGVLQKALMTADKALGNDDLYNSQNEYIGEVFEPGDDMITNFINGYRYFTQGEKSYIYNLENKKRIEDNEPPETLFRRISYYSDPLTYIRALTQMYQKDTSKFTLPSGMTLGEFENNLMQQAKTGMTEAKAKYLMELAEISESSYKIRKKVFGKSKKIKIKTKNPKFKQLKIKKPKKLKFKKIKLSRVKINKPVKISVKKLIKLSEKNKQVKIPTSVLNLVK